MEVFKGIVSDLQWFMEIRAAKCFDRRDAPDTPQPTRMYGDTYKFILGIQKGKTALHSNHSRSDDETKFGVSDWQDMYDEYGYGPFGEGMEVAKRIAFHSDRGFEISGKNGSDSTSSDFTIKSYE